MSFVPLPWCTSQSRTKTRSSPSESRACRAATATLLKKQNPIARRGSAWWPGGRSPLKPTDSPPPRLPAPQRLGERHRATCRVQSRVVSALARHSVRVERAAAALAHEADLVDVG